MKRILITGPEATGKSALCRALAHRFQSDWVREASRDFLNRNGGSYSRHHLDEILKLQLKAEADANKTGNQVLFCDTGPEVLYVWSDFKYGVVSEAIQSAVEAMDYDDIFLLYPDLPWEADPLRETPDQTVRESLFSSYGELLSRYNKTYHVIQGVGELRTQAAIAKVEQLLNN